MQFLGTPRTPELVTAYRDENRELCVRGTRTIAWIVILVMPVFLLVDAARFPSATTPLLWLRLLSFLVPLGVIALLRTPAGRRYPKQLSVAFAVAGSVLTTLMMAYTGGHESPYFGGIGLGMLLVALLMPWSPGWTWLTCAILIGTYVLVGEAAGFERRDEALANNVLSYLATAVIAGLATVSRERLRWQEFGARHALIESEHRLQEDAETWRALARAGRAMILSLDAPRVLDRLCELTAEILGCDVSHTLLHDAASDTWSPAAGYGHDPEQWSRLRRLRQSSAQVGHLLASLQRDGVVQTPVDASIPADSPLAVPAASGITHLMFAPLYCGKDLVAVQTAGFRGRTQPFTQAQMRIAAGLAQLASLALANARLHQELGLQAEAERAARAAAEVANSAKDDFLATLSHELRTPLNVILGYLEILGDPQVGPAERAELVARSTVASRHLLYMITDTLEISRIHSGQVGPQVEALLLEDFWRELRLQCDTLPRAASVELVWPASVPEITLSTDQHMLIVILRNLVSNALKFTDRGSVRVVVWMEGSELLFRVSDTGIGIPPEAMGRIFEMFHRVEGADGRRFGGIGLGLYIVERFASQIGATVEVSSSIGRGSTFTVRLPLEALRVAPAPGTRGVSSQPRGGEDAGRGAAGPS